MSTTPTFESFHADVVRTSSTYEDPLRELSVIALGLAGESGEVAEMVKKHLGHGHVLDKTKLVKELGDVLFYLDWAATHMGITLAEVAQINMDKRLERYPHGFEQARTYHNG